MTIDMPARKGCIVSSTFGLETNTQSFVSPITKNVQRLALGGARWRMTVTLRKMLRGEVAAAEWASFFLQCEGMANSFNAFDPDRQTPRGSGLGSPLVLGASQTGSQILVDGFIPSDQSPLCIADRFSVNGELKQIIYGYTPGSNVIADISGQAYINFKPAIRTSPADNAPLTIARPTCTMILADDSQGIWECDRNGVYQEKTFTAFEVFE